MAKFKVDGNTSLYALAGKFISFSPVPEFFNEISSVIGYNSIMFPVSTEQYGIIKSLDAFKVINCRGALIDTPHRCKLNDCLATVSEEASSCSAVNIVRIDEQGIHGHNTEISAFRKAFPKITGEELHGKEIFIFGSGGIARAIAFACALEQCKCLTIANPASEKAHKICELLNNKFDNIAFAADFDDAKTIHSFYNADIIIQATPVGMFPQVNVQPLPENFNFMSHHIVIDTIYNPPLTKLMLMADKRGSKAYNGRDIMFYNCFEAFQWWTDIKIDEEYEKKLFKIWEDLIYNI